MVTDVMPELLLAVVSILAPIMIAIFNQVGWDPKVKQAVTFGVAMLISAVYLVGTGHWDPANIVATITEVYTLGQLAYQFLLKNIATQIEAATSNPPAVVVVNDPMVVQAPQMSEEPPTS